MHEHELVKNAVAKGQVLIVSTSSDVINPSKPEVKTGVWLAEVAEPYEVFKTGGYDVTIASIKGGEIPVDANSLAENFVANPLVKRFQADDAAMQMLKNSVPLDSITDPSAYDAIFLPGGHGTCADFGSPALAELVTKMAAAGKIISSVCHGPTGLVNAKGADGKPLVAGKKVTGFSNTEEDTTGHSRTVPYLLEDKLKELGGVYSKGGDWQEHVQVDGKLVTGQNPQSSEAVGKAVLELLEAARK